MQAAALAVCQYLAVESAHPSSPLFEESSSSEATTPVTVQHVRPPKQKKQKTSPIPPLPIVLQLMEMGFPRKNIEFALKSLSGTTGSASGVPGTVSHDTTLNLWNTLERLCLQTWSCPCRSLSGIFVMYCCEIYFQVLRLWWAGCWTIQTFTSLSCQMPTRCQMSTLMRRCWRSWRSLSQLSLWYVTLSFIPAIKTLNNESAATKPATFFSWHDSYYPYVCDISLQEQWWLKARRLRRDQISKATMIMLCTWERTFR